MDWTNLVIIVGKHEFKAPLYVFLKTNSNPIEHEDIVNSYLFVDLNIIFTC